MKQFNLKNKINRAGFSYGYLPEKNNLRRCKDLLLNPLFLVLFIFPVSSLISTLRAQTPTPEMTVIQQWQTHKPVEEGQLKDSAYRIMKDIGITSLQSYVGWAQIEPDKSKLTFKTYDPVVNQLKKHNLKWLPFLILGTKISTPEWFKKGDGVFAVCLEHRKPTRIQSIWNPQLKKAIKRFLILFKKHYDTSVIEALNLGISGNWGESIYPVSGGFNMEGVHTHLGWWCGDEFARADFHRWLKKNFKTVKLLNDRWGSHYSCFDSIQPFLPEGAPSQRAKVDFANWYEESMTNYAEYWIKTARRLFPTLPIYLCTGGSGQLEHGADFGAQAKMCAKYDVGIRITNMNDDMQRGFAITRMVSSASRFYGGYYTTEPGGKNTSKGVVGRIFDIVSGGGVGVYFKALYQDKESNYDKIPVELTQNAKVFKRGKRFLIRNNPEHKVAALMSNSSLILDNHYLEQFLARSADLRDLLDFDYIDENMISDDALKGFKAVAMLSGSELEQSSIDKLENWIKEGGIFFTSEDAFPIKLVDEYKVSWMDSTLTHEPIGLGLSDMIHIEEVGNGFIVVCPKYWKEYKRILAELLFTNEGPWRRIAEPIDGVFDKVLITETNNSILYYNNSDKLVHKKINDLKKIDIRPRRIINVKK